MAASLRSRAVGQVGRIGHRPDHKFMTSFDALIERYKGFAGTDAKNAVPSIPFIPNKQLYVMTCIDPQVDPTNTLGLELGDAIVARNVGGRVTAAVLQDVAWITHSPRGKNSLRRVVRYRRDPPHRLRLRTARRRRPTTRLRGPRI
jgi:hypothetical protein